MPSAKKIVYVVFRPMRSDNDAQKIRPPMLKRLSRLVNPAAAETVTRPLKISWIIGEAIASTAIPAVTFMHRTPQRNQNCGVFHATSTGTEPVSAVTWVSGGGVQPAGFQPAFGNRYPNAPAIMATK